MAVQGSKRSHHLAAVVRADHVVERIPGGTCGHEGGGAVVENQAVVGNWIPAAALAPPPDMIATRLESAPYSESAQNTFVVPLPFLCF